MWQESFILVRKTLILTKALPNKMISMSQLSVLQTKPFLIWSSLADWLRHRVCALTTPLKRGSGGASPWLFESQTRWSPLVIKCKCWACSHHPMSIWVGLWTIQPLAVAKHSTAAIKLTILLNFTHSLPDFSLVCTVLFSFPKIFIIYIKSTSYSLFS